MNDYVRLLRPSQWVKNVFVFAGPGFGLALGDPEALWRTVLAFAAFCLTASTCYIINDVIDREQDRQHPTKRDRPVASGRLAPSRAMGVAVATGAGAVGLAGLLPQAFAVVLAAYFALILVYSLVLKQMVIVDVIAISLGFVLRALGGALAAAVYVSPWLIVCTFTLCLFLGFGKRRCELAMMGTPEQARQHRNTLALYTPETLNHMLNISAAIAVVTFLLYTMEPDPRAVFPKQYLVYTAPIVIFCVLRYALLIETERATGPTDIILKDGPFLIAVALWTTVAMVVAYWGRQIGAWLADHGGVGALPGP